MANAGFENAIKNYLDKRAESDRLFAESYRKENKSIQECCNYILSEVKKIASKGMAALTDDEVFGMAVHYYDEDDVKAEKNIHANVVITGEYAPKEPVSDVKEKPKKVAKPKVTKKDPFEDRQLSLFGF